MTSPSRSELESQPSSRWQGILCAGGAAWVIGWLGTYFQLRLPNNAHVARTEILANAGLWLMELVFPLADQGEKVGWSYLPQRFPLAAVSGGILLSGWCLGRLLCRPFRLGSVLTRTERFVLDCGVGLAGVSLLTLGLGLAGSLSRPLFLALWGSVIAAELVCSLRDRRGNVQASSGMPPSLSGSQWSLYLAACFPFLMCIVLGGLLPQVDFDVKEYHFGGPKEWYQRGEIVWLPHNVYTSFPFLTEMLILCGMVLKQDWYWGALAGNGALAMFGPLTAVALYAAGKRWFGTPAGLLAAWLHLSTPWIFRISSIAYAEGGLCFYLFAALFATLLAHDCRQRPTASHEPARPAENGPVPRAAGRLFLLAGILAGSAMACKYPGVVSAVIPLGGVAACGGLFGPRSQKFLPAAFAAADTTVAVTPTRRGKWVDASALLCYTLGVAFAVGPWLLKNAVQTGNPVYPLLYGLFGGADWDAELNAKWKRAHSPDHYHLSDLPYQAFDIAARNDWQSPLLFAFVPLALIVRAERRRIYWLFAFLAYLFLTWWLLTHRLDRFWVPLLPVASWLGGIGGTWLWPRLQSSAAANFQANSRWINRLWTCLLCGSTGLTGVYVLALISTGLAGYNAFLTDLETAARFTAQHTAPEIVTLNERLPPHAMVLCVGEAEIFDARFPLLYNTVFDKSLFEEFCGESGAEYQFRSAERPLRSAAEIRQRFVEQGITHVFVNWQEILRYRTTYGYTEFVSPRKFAELESLGLLDRPWQIPTAYQKWNDLNAQTRQQVLAWGPRLKVRLGTDDWLQTFAVYPVRTHP